MSDTHSTQRAATSSLEKFSKLYAEGNESEALEVAMAALSSGAAFDPPFESIWWLCDELRRRRRFQLALSLISRACDRGYRGWRAFYLRGMLEALNRRMRSSVETLKEALAQAPEDKRTDVGLLLARVQSICGEYLDAQRLFKKHLDIRAHPPRITDIAVKTMFKAGKEDVGLNWARQSTIIHGTSAYRARYLAEIYMGRHEWSEARRIAEEGLRVDSGNVELQRLIALALFHEGRVVSAVSQLEKLAKSDSDWTEGKIALCKGLITGGRTREANEIFRSIEDGSKFAEEMAFLRQRLDQKEDVLVNDEAVGRDKRRKTDPMQDPEVRHLLANVPADFAPSWTQEAISKSGGVLRATGKLVQSVRTIMLRETLARFGRHELGYLWAIIEPLIHVAVVSCIFYFIRARDTLGMNVVLFVATGVIPLFFYMKTYSGLTNVLKQNRPLLNHPSIQPMDIFLARSVLEFFTQLLVLIVFVLAIYVFVEEYTFGNVWSILANLFGLWITGIGMGLLIGSIVVFAESIKNVMDGTNRLVYVTSGIFFTLDMMPHAIAEYLKWNPLLHFVDGVRGNFNPLMGGTRVDIGYGYTWALAILFIGLIADRALRNKVLDR